MTSGVKPTRAEAAATDDAISLGASIGARTWASRMRWRPSHENVRPYPRLISAGTLRTPVRPFAPSAVVRPSENARPGR